MAPNGARRIFPTNSDLADILGDTGFDFDNFCFLYFLGPTFLVWSLGPDWAQLLAGLGPGVCYTLSGVWGNVVTHKMFSRQPQVLGKCDAN